MTLILLLLSTSFVGISHNLEKMEEPSIATGNGGLMDSAWPMKCHDLRHTAQSQYSAANNPPGVEKWRFRTSDVIEGASIIGDDGVIYVGDFDSYVYAINPNGTEKWRYQTGMWVWSAPALAEDGTLYVTSYDDYLYALYSNNGTRKWRFCTGPGGSISSSPAVGEDGAVYFGVMGPGWDIGRIYAINSNGTEKWHYDTGYWIVSDPAVGDDGTIYIGSGDSYLYALFPNGTLRWRFKTGDDIKGHPSIAQDGIIYIPSSDGYLYALYPNGTMKWEVNTGFGASSSAAIAEDGMIYIGTNRLRAIFPNGTIKWSLDVGGNFDKASPAISADGTIYVCVASSLIAVNPDGTEIWRKQIGKAESSPAIAEDGTIYVGSGHDHFGYLHAFGPGPLIADAGGPYSGNAEEEIQFTGTVFGGVPEYSYHWDFGDGNTSDEQNPKYAYGKSGEYIATFTVIDSEGNYSSDNATVSVDTAIPTVEITKPENALYLVNIRLFSLSKPLIIGPINIKVDASQAEVGINRVEFYIDNELKATDIEEPYNWIWKESSRLRDKHAIKVIAVDNSEKSSSDNIEVRKLF